MFMDGIPVRGCLSCGVAAIYKNECSVVVSGKAYVVAIRNADNLEFSGTVLTDGFNEAYNKNMKNLGAPMSCALQLPCAVKDKINNKVAFKKMWCLDWLDDTDFLKDGSDIRQLIVDSFAGHGKDVYDSVVDKINNTETVNDCSLRIGRRENNVDAPSNKTEAAIWFQNAVVRECGKTPSMLKYCR